MGAWCAAPALDFLPSAPPYAAATVSPGLTRRDEFHRENAPTASTAPAAALYAAAGGGTSASAACREWPACERCCGRPYYEPSIPTATEPYLTPLLGEGCSCFCWLPLLDLFRLCRRCKGGTPPSTERGANPPHAEDMPPPPQLQICCWKA